MLLFESTSDWIVALGLTMLHSLWVGFLLLGASAGLNAMNRHGSSRSRYRLNLAAFFTLAILSALIFIRLYEPVQHLEVRSDASRSFAFLPGGISEQRSWLETGSYLVAIFYFAGVLLHSLHLLGSYGKIQKYRRKGERVPEPWEVYFEQLKLKLRTGHRIRLLGSSGVTSPMLVGILKPVIMVPLSIFTMLPVSQVESILSHELYHFKRYDHLLNLLQAVVEVILFYHPAVHILSARIRREREICCDEAVVSSGFSASDYARALYQLANAQEVHAAMAMAATGQKKHLKARITHIINMENMKQTHKEKRFAVLLVAAAALLVMGLSGFSSAFSIQLTPEAREQTLAGIPEPEPAVEEVIAITDTIREAPEAPEAPEAVETLETVETLEALPSPEEEIDWESIQEEIELARAEAIEAIEEIDWESIREEMEAAHAEAKEAMEEIDWESIREEVEAAHAEAKEAMEEIDWESIREEVEVAREEAMKAIDEIDWEEIRREIELEMDSIQVHLKDFNLEDLAFDLEDFNLEDLAFDLEDFNLEDLAIDLEDFNLEDMTFDLENMDFDLGNLNLNLDSLMQGLAIDGFQNLDF